MTASRASAPASPAEPIGRGTWARSAVDAVLAFVGGLAFMWIVSWLWPHLVGMAVLFTLLQPALTAIHFVLERRRPRRDEVLGEAVGIAGLWMGIAAGWVLFVRT